MRPSKYLFEHMYDVAMDARRDKKVLLSQFDSAIGLKFAAWVLQIAFFVNEDNDCWPPRTRYASLLPDFTAHCV